MAGPKVNTDELFIRECARKRSSTNDWTVLAEPNITLFFVETEGLQKKSGEAFLLGGERR